MFKDMSFKDFSIPIVMILCIFLVVTLYFGMGKDKPVRNTPEQYEVHRVCGTEGMAQGIDVSYYQSTIDWNVVAEETDVEFAITRVSDGTTKLDPKFYYNWNEIKRVGLTRGAYQFFRPNQDALAQAELMVNVINEAGGMDEYDLPPTIDVETTGGMPKEVVIQGMSVWIEYVMSETNKIPIIYTGPAFWDSNKLGGHFADYPLWIAHYTDAKCPWAPDAWAHWEFWQYTGSGTLPGIQRPVDINVFNGDKDDLLHFINIMNVGYYEDASADATKDASVDVFIEAEADVVEDITEPTDAINEFPNIFDAGGPTPPNVGCSCSTPGR